MTLSELIASYECTPIVQSGVINFHHRESDTWIGATSKVNFEHLYLSRLEPNYITVVGDNATVANVLHFQNMGARVIHYDDLYEYLYRDGEGFDDEEDGDDIIDASTGMPS